MSEAQEQDARGRTLADYWPLISLIALSALAAWALALGSAEVDMRRLMHGYMGVFLFVFALLKTFDLNGFKDGFTMYDLLAKRFHAYAYLYPFVELALALMYMAHFEPTLTYWVTIGLFSFSAIGVINALSEGLDVDCPCMGSALSVPLSTVTLTEDMGMVVMASVLLAV